MNIPGYELFEVIGRGGTSVVYRARQRSLERTVAIKVLRPEFMEDENTKKRFLQGGKQAAKIFHPASITIYETGETEDACFISMEYLTGGNFREALRFGIDTDKALSCLVQVCDALAAAHRLDVVHGDIKPHNILFRDENQAVLSDYSGLTEETAFEGNYTVGSPYYICPEQIEGAPPRPTSDIYSAGCLLYEILTGKHPFEGENAQQTIEQHLLGNIPELPRQHHLFRNTIQRMLARKPADRYRSMAQVSFDLRRIMEFTSGASSTISGALPGYANKTASLATALGPNHLNDTQVIPMPLAKAAPANGGSSAAPAPVNETSLEEAPSPNRLTAIETPAAKNNKPRQPEPKADTQVSEDEKTGAEARKSPPAEVSSVTPLFGNTTSEPVASEKHKKTERPAPTITSVSATHFHHLDETPHTDDTPKTPLSLWLLLLLCLTGLVAAALYWSPMFLEAEPQAQAIAKVETTVAQPVPPLAEKPKTVVEDAPPIEKTTAAEVTVEPKKEVAEIEEQAPPVIVDRKAAPAIQPVEKTRPPEPETVISEAATITPTATIVEEAPVTETASLSDYLNTLTGPDSAATTEPTETQSLTASIAAFSHSIEEYDGGDMSAFIRPSRQQRRGPAQLDPGSEKQLEQLARVLRDSKNVDITIVDHRYSDSGKALDTALSIADLLALQGISSSRLSATTSTRARPTRLVELKLRVNKQ